MSKNDKSNKRCPATKRNLLAQLPDTNNAASLQQFNRNVRPVLHVL